MAPRTPNTAPEAPTEKAVPAASEARKPAAPLSVNITIVRACPYTSSTFGRSWRIQSRLKTMCKRLPCR